MTVLHLLLVAPCQTKFRQRRKTNFIFPIGLSFSSGEGAQRQFVKSVSTGPVQISRGGCQTVKTGGQIKLYVGQPKIPADSSNLFIVSHPSHFLAAGPTPVNCRKTWDDKKTRQKDKRGGGLSVCPLKAGWTGVAKICQWPILHWQTTALHCTQCLRTFDAPQTGWDTVQFFAESCNTRNWRRLTGLIHRFFSKLAQLYLG